MSQPITTSTRTFDFGKVDWEAYESYRPPYPDHLYEKIFQHHKEQGGRWDIALDVGAGGGTVTKVLLQHFRHVVWSDAAAGYVSQAMERFAEEKSAERIDFVQRKFHEFDPETDLPGGRHVDMVTAGTCIHFSDPSKITTQLAKLVRTGGTLAAFSYGALPILPSDDPAKEPIARTKDTILKWIHENVTAIDQAEGTGTGQARFKNVDFDPELWTNVRRITSLPNELIWPAWIRASDSRVREDIERLETVQDNFITKLVDYDFFPEYFRNFAPGYEVSKLIEHDLEEIKAAVGDRKILARWPVIMVLATRR